MSDQRAVDALNRLAQLKAQRSNFDSIWQDVHDIVWPDGGDFTTERAKGEKRTDQVFDMTAAQSLEYGAAALETFLTPRTQKWHRLTASDPELAEDSEVKDWCERATDVLFRMRNASASQFYSQMHEGWKSLLAYGNDCLFVEERPKGGIRYRYTHVGKTWMDVNHENVIDTVYHEYPLSAKAAVQRWGEKAPKSAHQAMGANEAHREHIYVHCVRPNPDAEPGKLSAKAMAFESFEISVDGQEILEEGGYREFPYMWSRYTVNPAEKYGRGPGMLLLPEIQTLQEMARVLLRSGHKAADPPLLLAHDGVLGRGQKRVSLRPGGLNVGGLDSQGRPLIAPLITGARIDITLEMMESIKRSIRSGFYVDFYEIFMEETPAMTATEVIERARQRGQIIAPMVGRQQEEKLGLMIHRELSIAMRQGQLPPMPESLKSTGGDYAVEYDSDATRMQKASESSSIMQTIGAMAPMIEANPALLEVFKGAETLRHIAEINGVPSKLLNSPTEYKRIERANAEAAKQQAEIENAQGGAKALRDVSAARGAA